MAEPSRSLPPIAQVQSQPTQAQGAANGLPGAAVAVPDVFAPIGEQLKWLGTPAGQSYLARTPELMQMFFDGTLHACMHRPDWPRAALRWRDYRDPGNRRSPRADLTHNLLESGVSWPHFSTPEEFGFFYKHGYFVLRRAVSGEILKNAQRLVAASTAVGEASRDLQTGGGLRVRLSGPVLADPDIVATYYDSVVHDAMQRLINGPVLSHR